MKPNMLVINHQTGTITVTKGGVSRFAPIKRTRTLPHLEALYREKHYFVKIIEKGTPPMALTPTQQAEVNHNHFLAIRRIRAGAENIHQMTRTAMINRGFINDALEILPPGEQFFTEYAATHPEAAEAPLPVRTRQARKGTIVDAAVTPTRTETQPAIPTATDDAARSTILELRRVAMNLGRALVKERVPELDDLFAAIERSDEYLFK
jgi:hypothetical protein